MGYRAFKTLRQALERLDIEEFNLNLFPQIDTVEPSDWLNQTLQLAELMPLTNEKSKSERIISPILLEVSLAFKENITLYSGEDLYIDDKRDLSGACDFFLAKHPLKTVMQAPIITLAEAKDEDMDYGKGQCLAQMYGAQIFNEQKGKSQPFLYGCAVTGDDWKFMRLEGRQVYIDTKTYYLSDLPKILGIFHQIVKIRTYAKRILHSKQGEICITDGSSVRRRRSSSSKYAQNRRFFRLQRTDEPSVIHCVSPKDFFVKFL
jgi:hypothetical protein